MNYFDENQRERSAGLAAFAAQPQRDPFSSTVQRVESQSPIGKFAAMNMEAMEPGSFINQPAQPPQEPGFLAKLAGAFVPGLRGSMENNYESNLTKYAMSLPHDDALQYLAAAKPDKYLPMFLNNADPMRQMQMEQTAMSLSDAKRGRAGRDTALSRLTGMLDPLTQSQITQESGGDPMAVSSAGAAGIMQIMPDTARDPGYGVQPLQGWDGKDPRTAPIEEQIRFGIDYRNAMIKQFGSVEKGLQAYNAGPGKLEDVQAGRAAMPAETAAYAPAIMNRMGAQPEQATAQPQSAIQRMGKMTPQQEFDYALAQGGDASAIQRLSASLAQEQKAPVTTGLPTGQMWENGKAVPIPGVQQPKGDFKEYQLKPAGFAARMINAENMLTDVNPNAAVNNTASALGAIPFIGDYAAQKARSPEEQKYKNLADEWIRSKLRKESGASIGDEEMAKEYRTYFPQPGDEPETIAQKAELRAQAVDVMKKESNGAFEAQFPELAAAPAKPTSREAFDALPKGAMFINPKDGKLMRKK